MICTKCMMLLIGAGENFDVCPDCGSKLEHYNDENHEHWDAEDNVRRYLEEGDTVRVTGVCELMYLGKPEAEPPYKFMSLGAELFAGNEPYLYFDGQPVEHDSKSNPYIKSHI